MTNLAGATPRELIPGDPALLESLATRVRTVAEGLDHAGEILRSISGGSWTGTAARAFQHTLHQQPTKYAKGAAAFGIAASAIDTYASALADAQRQAGQAISAYEDAEAASAAWRQKKEAADRAALTPGIHPTVFVSGSDPGDSGRGSAQQILDSAHRELDQAAATLRSTLAGATDDAPHAPSLFGQLMQELRTFARQHHLDYEALVALYHVGHSVLDVKDVRELLEYAKLANQWDAVAPLSPLAREAELQLLEHFPTWNNSLGAKAAVAVLDHLPGGEGLAAFLRDASRATPFFRVAGAGLSAVSTGFDAYGLYSDWHHHVGAKTWTVDITHTAFDATSTALMVAPSPVTAIAFGIAAVAYGGAEAWKHWDAIEHLGGEAYHFAGGALKYEWNHTVPGMVWNNRHEIGQVLDQGADLGSAALHGVGHAISDLNPF